MSLLHQAADNYILYAAWCCVVLRGVAWCCVVLRNVAWCCVMLRDAAWCCVLLCSVAWCGVVMCLNGDNNVLKRSERWSGTSEFHIL